MPYQIDSVFMGRKERIELSLSYENQFHRLARLPISPLTPYVNDSRLSAAYLFLIYIPLFRAFARLVAA